MSGPKKDPTNTMLFHHYKQISACGQIIDNMLTKLENMGFQPTEVYYAFMQHVHHMRFAFEDSDMEKVLQIIDREMAEDIIEHRKKHPKGSGLSDSEFDFLNLLDGEEFVVSADNPKWRKEFKRMVERAFVKVEGGHVVLTDRGRYILHGWES